ncbi:hypothetical protein FOCC_FOCC007526, partial [Frankliniella occidentalis]
MPPQRPSPWSQSARDSSAATTSIDTAPLSERDFFLGPPFEKKDSLFAQPVKETRKSAEMSGITKTSKYTYRSTGHGGGDANVSIEYSADLSALTRLEDKIRLLQEDLESERELRQR